MQPTGNTTPATAAATTNATSAVPITAALRNFYQNIVGTPTSQQAESDIAQYNKLTPRSADILSAFDEQYGVNAQAQRVGDLRKSVMSAEDLVNNIDDNVFARTSNALVSDAQRARLTAAEKDPLVKQLGVISRNFDIANQDLAGLREQSNRYSGAELGDIQTQRESLTGRLTTAQQREEAERVRKQQEEQNRQWWENFYLEKAKTDAYISNLRAQTEATRRQSNALLSSITASQSNNSAAQRQAALQAEALRQANITATRNAANTANSQVAKNTVNSRYNTGNIFTSFGNYIADKGPLALFGGLF